ncbi:MAG: TusE/DsrC/DsvC family sulfur relay protein [Acidiferrobacterales bacterium]
MTDIMKFIVNKDTADKDVEANLMDLDVWDESVGSSLAQKEGLEMTEAHWKIVHFLRRYYMEHGETPNARKLTEVLEKEYSDKGGRKYLYRLFPKGPVTQASRIAGLPVPHYSVDPSFGSSQ